MIGIGISTYNDYTGVDNLLTSIIKKTDAVHGKDYSVMVVDDGTVNQQIVSNLQNICNKHGVRLNRNQSNRGIPYTWNRIVENIGTDIVFIFNNDILVANSQWLRHFEYFINRNDNIGMVGLPLINPPDFKIQNHDICNITWDGSIESRWGEFPGHVGAAVGCCFGFKKNVWEKVKNPDGTTGFWEDLISFHEETHFGFKLSEMGYYNYMLPWPPMIHYGGQTFAKNNELLIRPVDWTKWNRQEYIDIVSASNVYPTNWKKENKIVWNCNGEEVVDRMAFSRYMFAKYWNVLYKYDMPQVEIHRRLIDPMPKRRLRWLGRNFDNRNEEVG